jgi:small subunit ribosomal protein S16
VAVKIKLKRLGKMRNPQYRIVIADARAKRDGRSIEEIGIYQPKEEPSLIQIDSERAQYWLGVGAQPTEPVLVLLKITGDWQKYHGLPGAEGTLRVAPPRPDKRAIFEEAVRDGAGESLKTATTGKKKAEAKAEPKADAKAEAKAEPKADAKTEAKAEPKTEAKADAEAPVTEAPATDAVEAAAATETVEA